MRRRLKCLATSSLLVVGQLPPPAVMSCFKELLWASRILKAYIKSSGVCAPSLQGHVGLSVNFIYIYTLLRFLSRKEIGLQLCTWNKPRFYGIYCRSCSVCTVCATCNVISPVKYVLYFYISTFHSTRAVPNTAVVCSSLISCFLGMLFRFIIIITIIIFLLSRAFSSR